VLSPTLLCTCPACPMVSFGAHRTLLNPPAILIIQSSSSPAQTCFVLPIKSPLTLLQSMLASNSSSTSPHTTTLSPRTRYRPCGCSVEGSSSPCSRMIRSTVSASTRLVTWSQDTRVPVRVRPSTVMMRTFSGEGVRVVHSPGLCGVSQAYCLRSG
jgi:hypothetical protein